MEVLPNMFVVVVVVVVAVTMFQVIEKCVTWCQSAYHVRRDRKLRLWHATCDADVEGANKVNKAVDETDSSWGLETEESCGLHLRRTSIFLNPINPKRLVDLPVRWQSASTTKRDTILYISINIFALWSEIATRHPAILYFPGAPAFPFLLEISQLLKSVGAAALVAALISCRFNCHIR